MNRGWMNGTKSNDVIVLLHFNGKPVYCCVAWCNQTKKIKGRPQQSEQTLMHTHSHFFLRWRVLANKRFEPCLQVFEFYAESKVVERFWSAIPLRRKERDGKKTVTFVWVEGHVSDHLANPHPVFPFSAKWWEHGDWKKTESVDSWILKHRALCRARRW